MLWNASTISGFAVDATDGRLGVVADMLFDGEWRILWLVVDAEDRRVMLPVAQVAKSSAELRRVSLKLPLAQAGQGEAADAAGLWSVTALLGYQIEATDGGIGKVEDLLVHDSDWRIRFITADARSWDEDGTVMISRHAVTGIDAAAGVIRLDVGRQAVKDSPPYDEGISVDGADDDKFLSYFGIKFVKRVAGAG